MVYACRKTLVDFVLTMMAKTARKMIDYVQKCGCLWFLYEPTPPNDINEINTKDLI